MKTVKTIALISIIVMGIGLLSILMLMRASPNEAGQYVIPTIIGPQEPTIELITITATPIPSND